MTEINVNDSRIVIPAGTFNDRGVHVAGGESPISDLINGGNVGAPEDGFTPEAPTEPKPENSKLNEAIQNRENLNSEYSEYHRKRRDTIAAKDNAKAEMKAKKTAMNKAKQARRDAMEALQEAKNAVKKAGSTEEAAKALGNAQSALNTANTNYKNAVKAYNASVKTFNKYISFCLKHNTELVKMQKAVIKADKNVTKLGGKPIYDKDFGTKWFKYKQSALKSEKIPTELSKYAGKLFKYGLIGIGIASFAGMGVLAYKALFNYEEFESLPNTAKKNAAKTVPTASTVSVAPGDTVAEVVKPVFTAEPTDSVTGLPPVAADSNTVATAGVTASAVVNEEQANAATAAEAENSTTVTTPTEEAAALVDETAVEREIAAEDAKPIYEVQENDCIWNICRKELKDKNGKEPAPLEIIARIGEVVENNGLHWEADGQHVMIYPKQKLKM